MVTSLRERTVYKSDVPSSGYRFALNEILSTENKLAIKHLVIFVYLFSVNEAVVILGVDTKVLHGIFINLHSWIFSSLVWHYTD
jgi:hypothetical protein